MGQNMYDCETTFEKEVQGEPFEGHRLAVLQPVPETLRLGHAQIATETTYPCYPMWHQHEYHTVRWARLGMPH